MTGKRKYLADYTMTSTTERVRVGGGGGARERERTGIVYENMMTVVTRIRRDCPLSGQ